MKRGAAGSVGAGAADASGAKGDALNSRAAAEAAAAEAARPFLMADDEEEDEGGEGGQGGDGGGDGEVGDGEDGDQAAAAAAREAAAEADEARSVGTGSEADRAEAAHAAVRVAVGGSPAEGEKDALGGGGGERERERGRRRGEGEARKKRERERKKGEKRSENNGSSWLFLSLSLPLPPTLSLCLPLSPSALSPRSALSRTAPSVAHSRPKQARSRRKADPRDRGRSFLSSPSPSPPPALSPSLFFLLCAARCSHRCGNSAHSLRVRPLCNATHARAAPSLPPARRHSRRTRTTHCTSVSLGGMQRHCILPSPCSLPAAGALTLRRRPFLDLRRSSPRGSRKSRIRSYFKVHSCSSSLDRAASNRMHAPLAPSHSPPTPAPPRTPLHAAPALLRTLYRGPRDAAKSRR